MRKPLVLLGSLVLWVACGRAEPAGPSRATSAPSPAPSTVEAPALAAWPAPLLARVAQRVSRTDRLTITPVGEGLDADVDVHVALGPTAASCSERDPLAPVRQHDGSWILDGLGPTESATVCVRDHDGHVRAQATSPGHRSVPWVSAMWRAGRVHVVPQITDLDDDVTALVVRTRPGGDDEADELRAPIACSSEASSGPSDDPPQHCTYACDAGETALEIPREAWDALLGSPAFDTDDDEDDDLLYPPTLAVSLPIALPAGHDHVQLCVRTRTGALVADTPRWNEIAEGPWDGCDFETVAGCMSAAGTFPEIARGDVLLGLDGSGAVVRAPVRSTRTRSTRARTITTTRGVLVVASDAQVRGENGADVAVATLEAGARLWSRSGVATVARVESAEYDFDRTRVDLEGATHVLSSGFAVRDEGPARETTRAPAHADLGVTLAGGDGDCALAAQWAAAATPGGVVVHAQPHEGHDAHVTRASTCTGEPRIAVDARTLAAIASMADGAEARVQLYGDAIDCSGDYWVSRCDAADQSAIGDAASWVATPQCVPVGTPIDTPAGPIAIEKLEPGDAVTTYDPARGLRTAQVLGATMHAHRALVAATLADGRVLRATPEHLVMAGTSPHPVAMRALAVGDVLSLHRDGALVPTHVVALASDGAADVVELRVSAPDTYFANGVLVHNY